MIFGTEIAQALPTGSIDYKLVLTNKLVSNSSDGQRFPGLI